MPDDDPVDELDHENPFERFRIDPGAGPGAITERMRALMEDARSDDEKKAIRKAWEALTKHPARRFRLAVAAHPGMAIEARRPPPLVLPRDDAPLAERDLVLRAAPSETALVPDVPDVPPEDDPILG